MQPEGFVPFSGRYLLNSPWNKLFHRDIIERNHLRMEEGLNIAEDLQFNMQYLDACGDVPVVICNTVQYRYVRTGQESLDNCYRVGYYDIHKRILTEQYRYAENGGCPERITTFFINGTGSTCSQPLPT